MAKKGQSKAKGTEGKPKVNGRLFQPGNTAGVGHGRPRRPSFKNLLLELGESTEMSLSITDAAGTTETVVVKSENGQSIAKALGVRLYQMALGGDVRAAQMIMERCEGRPIQPIEGGGNVIQLVVPERFLPELPDE